MGLAEHDGAPDPAAPAPAAVDARVVELGGPRLQEYREAGGLAVDVLVLDAGSGGLVGCGRTGGRARYSGYLRGW